MKRCPKCGGTGVINRWNYELQIPGEYFVCTECNGTGKRRILWWGRKK